MLLPPAILALCALSGCESHGGGEVPAIPLVDRFDEAVVSGSPESVPPPPPTEWRFDETADDEAPAESEARHGWRALHGVRDLQLREGRLVGTTGDSPLLAVAGPADPDPSDFFHTLEIEMKVSAGSRLHLIEGERWDDAFAVLTDLGSVARARKIQRFLSPPFHVAEQFTGMKGKYVKVADTIEGFQRIAAGELDDYPEQAFLYKGGIDEVVEHGKTLLERE
ncbi:MAG TPA: hypothetical protein VMN39_07285 [Longimicrobiaceae bacterium]|nr:hypothetical protein [Longimicrobiaceae bacterium]